MIVSILKCFVSTVNCSLSKQLTKFGAISRYYWKVTENLNVSTVKIGLAH